MRFLSTTTIECLRESLRTITSWKLLQRYRPLFVKCPLWSDRCRHGLRKSYADLVINLNSGFDADFHADCECVKHAFRDVTGWCAASEPEHQMAVVDKDGSPLAGASLMEDCATGSGSVGWLNGAVGATQYF